MRIIAGTRKGTRLIAPKSYAIRPTSDRVREYIYSCLQTDIVEKTVLDLFAGTGAFGLEAISRGAAQVVFVDNSLQAIQLVRQNLLKLGAEAIVKKKSAELYLRTCHYTFDYIFCDPPYEFQHFDLILRSIRLNGLLDKEGAIIYESSSRATMVQEKGFQISRQKEMGDTRVTFYTMDYEDRNLSRDV